VLNFVLQEMKSDIFSLGLCFYYVFTKGRYAFGETVFCHIDKLKRKEVPKLCELLPEKPEVQEVQSPKTSSCFPYRGTGIIVVL